MKKLLTIFLSIISLTLMAQVPQGVGYQGVATDANGIELVNQAISIRASVLSGSATGTIEWEETHATSTDTFGLFALTIGQGTSTGNGLQLSFADINPYPQHKLNNITYGRLVVSYRTQKEDKYHTLLTSGGDRVSYQGPI